MRGGLALALVMVGLAYLGYKAEYLALDSPDVLKAFIVSPSAILFVVAALVAFPDPRRRFGGSCLGIGLVALFWLAKEPLPGGGFYSAVEPVAFPQYFKGPNPYLVAAATFVPFMGTTMLARRSPIGGLLLAASLWCALCFSPSRVLDAYFGMPRRYSYYYFAPQREAMLQDRSDAILPILLGLAGTALTLKRGGGERSRRPEPSVASFASRASEPCR